MLTQRLIVILILLPIGIFAIAAGGWVLAAIVIAALGYGAWEYSELFKQGGFHPPTPILVIGVMGLGLARQLFQFQGIDILICVLVLLTMGVMVYQYEKGCNTSAVDFNITLGGILYLGVLGPYLLSLRSLPDGLWWFMVAMPAIWFADGTAYLVGSRFGRHKMTRRVSPNKSWEGYLAGVLAGALGAMLLASLWHMRAPAVTWDKGLLIGFIIAAISPLGDLGESMLKREFGVKDTSHLLPGHGGILDRVDSWLWAAPIGYYLLLHVWQVIPK